MGSRLWLAGIGVLSAVALVPRDARACGGFFCSQVPVDQSGEQILFSVEGDGTVVAHIQIQYQGAAEDFAWVLPLAAEPEISTGLRMVFSALRARSEPTFTLRWVDPLGECYGPAEPGPRPDYDSADAGAGLEGEGEVEVLSHGEVGPYETAVIASQDAEALLEWLEDNGYQIPESALPQIQAYVNIGDVFVALKLLKDRAVGDITPIVLRFPEVGPCIPLRLTSIAATPDLPVTAYVLASHRTVSTNFLDVELNLAAIDWFNAGANYRAVVTRAVDEAAGRAFVTEYSGTSSLLAEAFFREGQFDLDALRRIDDPALFVAELLAQGFPRDAQMLGLFRRFLPMPADLAAQGVDERDFYNCLECYREWLDDVPFDAGAFVDALEAEIVQPLRDVQEMADRQPILTRLFTTISPEEMVDDPIFRLNPDLPDVSQVHTAEAQVWCSEDGGDPTYRVTLPDGTVVFYSPGDPGYPGSYDYTWSDADGDGRNDNPGQAPEGMPSALRARQLGETGEGDDVLDNRGAIDDALADRYGPEPDPEPREPVAPPSDDPVPVRVGGGGCGMGAGPAHPGEASLVLLAALVLGALRRRHR